MTIVNRGGAVEVDPQPSQPKLDMSVLKSRTDDGELVLEEYLSAVREEYEKFLLDNGYECQTTDDGERYAWRYTGRRADTSGSCRRTRAPSMGGRCRQRPRLTTTRSTPRRSCVTW